MEQIAFMICEHFRVTGAHKAVLDYSDVFGITLHGDEVQEFGTRWDEVLLSISGVPSDDILESLYRMRIRESDQLKNVLALHEQEMEQHHSQPNYQKLKTVCMAQRNRARNFEARNERIETGVPVKTLKEKPVSLERKQAEYNQWSGKGQCTKGNACSFRHDERKRGKATQSSSLAQNCRVKVTGRFL